MDDPYAANDEALALTAAAGDRGAFEALACRYGSAVVAVLEKQCADHHSALDLAQEVWIKVFRAIARFRPEGSFRSWLFSIVLNHARDARRRTHRSRVVFLEDFREPTEPAVQRDDSGRSHEQAAIAAALERVVEPFKTAVFLVDVLQLSYDEAAASAGCAIGTMKSRVNRGRLAFRDHYTQQDGGPLAVEKSSGAAP